MYFLLVLIVWLLDQWTKKRAEDNLSLSKKKMILNDKASLRLVYNRGAFLGLFKDRPVYLHILTIVSIIVVLFIGAPYWLSGRGRLTGAGLVLILGGASGNYTDRLRRGHVVDFLAFAPKYKVHYNLADFAIFIGAGFIAIGAIIGE